MRSGAENQLRLSTLRRMLDLSLLISALPESSKATETSAGRFTSVEGQIDPQVLATVTAWCARLDVACHRHAGGAAKPGACSST